MPDSVAPAIASAQLPEGIRPAKIKGFWGEQLGCENTGLRWIWEGYLAAGNVTLLTSQWKSGKTTLVSVLLARLREGGTLAGLPVMPGSAVVVSEESPDQWRLRHRKLGFAHVHFLCRPFAGKPDLGQWLELIDYVADLRRHQGVVLLVIDTLACFLPGRNESAAGAMMEALLPLQRLTELGMAILLLHHPRKGESLPGQAARGSGALSGFVDIIMEMSSCLRAPESDRRRKLLAFSRHERTPTQAVIELSDAGTDYLTHGSFHDDEFARSWERLRLVLEDAKAKRTRQQLLADWPDDFPAPADSTLWTWLVRAVTLGLVRQEGTGRKTDPFRYWLPEQEQRWQQDPMYQLQQLMEQSNRQVMENVAKKAS